MKTWRNVNWLCGLALAASAPSVFAGEAIGPEQFTKRIESQAFASGGGPRHEHQYRMSQAELNTFLRGDSLTDDEWKFSRSLARDFDRTHRYSNNQNTDQGALGLSWQKRRNLASRLKRGYRDGTRRITRRVVGDRVAENLRVDVVGRPKIEYKVRF